MPDFFAKGNKPINGYAEPPAGWTLLDTVASEVTKTIPSDAKEILVVPNYNNAVSFSFYLLDKFDTSVYRDGYYYNANTTAYVDVAWDKTARTVKSSHITVNGQTVTATVKIYTK